MGKWLPPTLLALLPALALPGNGPSGEHATRPFHSAAVTENVVTLSELADLRLHVAAGFRYLGSTSFTLGGRAEADVFFFAQEKDDSIERLVKVQIESLTDEAASGYDWEAVDTLRVGEAEYLRGFWCFDAEQLARERPDSDTAKTQQWLAARGHRQPGVFVGTRLARVFADGRSEILIFYGETTKISGVDCEDESAAMQHLPSIVERSDAAFSLDPKPR